MGNDPRYNKTLCFDPFPFPDANDTHRAVIAGIAERLDAHRKVSIERDDSVTMTGMYNVVEKLRSGQKLTTKEREVHTHAACGILKDLHDELDRAVAVAYGWPNDLTDDEILSRLVALHGTRVREEEAGLVRWLRPEYQVERFGQGLPETAGDLDLLPADLVPAKGQAENWPEHPPQQLAALQRGVGERALTIDAIRKLFPAAKRADLTQHLEALVVLGLIRETDEGAFVSVRPTMVSAA